MKQRSLWFAMLLLVAALLAACTTPAAETAEPTEAAEPTEEVTAEPTEEVTAEPTEEVTAEPTEAATEEADMVELLVWADETRAPVIEALSAQAEVFGVTLSVQQMDFGSIRDQLKTAGPAGEGPDILIGAHDWLGELAVNGLVAEIDLGDKEELFLPSAVQAFTYDGSLYGMPYATENIAFVCNMDALGDNPVPTTWDEVQALAETLEADSGGEVTAWTLRTEDPYHYMPVMTSFGGYIFGVTEEGYDPTDVGLDSEGALAAAAFVQEMVEAGHIVPGIDDPTEWTLFSEGNLACINTGPWNLSKLQELPFEYSINAFPAGDAGPGRPFSGVQGFMVSAFSENQLLAQTVLTEIVATEEFMTAWFQADPRPSAFLPVREAIDDPDLAGFAAAGSEALPMPAIPEMNAVWAAWTNALSLTINQTQTGEEAFRDAAQQVRDAIGEGD